MSIHQYDELRASVPPGSLVDATPIIQAIRMVKSHAEIERLRKACEISQIGTRAGWEALRPGITEKELAAVISSAMFAAGAEVGTHPSFFGVGSGTERYKLGANALASDYALQKGDIVIVDGGAVYGGYVTDYIRQASIGPPTAEQQKFFDIAREANDYAIEAIRPGASCADIYEAAMSIFDRREVRQFSHHNIIGHGLGMDVHEVPWVGERGTVYTSGTVLEPGMVLCIEPVFARANDPDRRKGTWIQEDVVAVTATGHEVLTGDLSKELWIQPIPGAASAF
jgi:Xaa-Pro aminopeptidase